MRLIAAIAIASVVLIQWGLLSDRSITNEHYILYSIEFPRPRSNIVWSANGDGLLFAGDGGILLWDFENNELSTLIDTQSLSVHSISWSPDGQTIAWSAVSDITLWRNTQPPTVTHLDSEYEWHVMGMTFSPDSSMLAAHGYRLENWVTIWDVETGVPLQRLYETDENSIWSIAFSPDSSMLAVGSEGVVTLRDIESGEVVRELAGFQAGPGEKVPLWPSLAGILHHAGCIVWSPDGNEVAAGSNNFGTREEAFPSSIIVWDVESGEMLRFFDEAPNGVYDTALSPDGSLLASTASNTVRIWDFESGELLHTLEGHTDWVLNVLWSPDGQMLASSGLDDMLIIWDNPIDNGQ